MPLANLLTPSEPFGPVDQTEVMDTDDALHLIAYTELISATHRRRVPLVYGRRGSGKSVIICAYHDLEYVRTGRRRLRNNKQRDEESDYVVGIVTWEHFDEMTRAVFRDAFPFVGRSDANNGTELHVPAERLESIWRQKIWDQIFNHFYGLYRMQRIPARELRSVIQYVDTHAPPSAGETAADAAHRIFTAAKTEINAHLAAGQRRCFVLFDSMEEYPINNPAFKGTLSGFLRAIKRFHLDSPQISTIFCLPEELMPHFTSASSNILKDFDKALAIRWTPAELLRIAAHRYRLFLEAHRHQPTYATAYEQFKDLDFRNSRTDLNFFYSKIMPQRMVNGLAAEESALAYLIRHTQLLPRHILMYLNEIARLSYELTGGWRFEGDAIKMGIERREEFVAAEILRPYEFLYPDLRQALVEIMADLPPIFSFGQLDRLLSRIRRSFELERQQLRELLFNMGIIGLVVSDSRPAKGRSVSDIYTYAEFHFNSSRDVGFSSKAEYCVHPVFSRYFGCFRNRRGDQRVVYPANVDDKIEP